MTGIIRIDRMINVGANFPFLTPVKFTLFVRQVDGLKTLYARTATLHDTGYTLHILIYYLNTFTYIPQGIKSAAPATS